MRTAAHRVLGASHEIRRDLLLHPVSQLLLLSSEFLHPICCRGRFCPG